MNLTDAAKAVETKAVVQYKIGTVLVFWGIAESLSADGWIGVRQTDGRLDEAPAVLCEFDPT